MLPTKRFNDLPLVSGLADSDKLFCVAGGIDSLITVGALKIIFGSGVISTGEGDPFTFYRIPVSLTYSGLIPSGYGAEYYQAPYIYKNTYSGIVRINPDTEFDIPTGVAIATGFLVANYADLLLAASSYEYHELPYVYKKYQTGIFRINAVTEFDVPSGSSPATGMVIGTYSGLLESLPGYEYHEMPYIYKRTYSGAVRIEPDTEFTIPDLDIVVGSYSLLTGASYGYEYHEQPYIYKITPSGVVRILANTVFSIPSGSGCAGGIVVETYSNLLNSVPGYEYHESSYVYKKNETGVYRINADTVFPIPSGSGVASGIMLDTYSNLLLASLGYEYYEAPYLYKKTCSGALRISPDTSFLGPEFNIVVGSYSILSGSSYGFEYHEHPYIYKLTSSGIVRIGTNTTYPIPSGSGISGGIVVGTYSGLLASEPGYEYHELPYIYKQHSSGTYRINVDTSFAVPSGTGTNNGIVVSTYSGLLTSSLGYEYHEMPYIYKRTSSGAVRINPDTGFPSP